MTRAALLAIAIAALWAAPAQAAFSVTNVHAAPVSTAAGANSNFTLSFDLPGDEPIKDLDIDLPAGLLGNPNVPARCTQAQFDGDNCPATSKVGTQSVNATITIIAVPTTVDLTGEVFNLVPHSGEPARLGIKLNPPMGLPLGTTHLESAVRIRTESDNGLTSTLRSIPNTNSGMSVKINSISLTLNANSNGGKFMRNPTSCGPAPTHLRAVGYSGTVASGDASFTPTACDALPFAPKLTATVGGAGNTAAKSHPALTTVIEQAAGEAGSKSAVVTLSQPLGPDIGVLANACSVADYDADTCPDKSQVGTATAVTPLLATPLSGPVRLVATPGNLPRLVVYLNGIINLRLTGQTGLGANQTTVNTFSTIPDVPLSRFELKFTGGPGGLIASSADLCKTAANINGQFTAQSGKTENVDTVATVQGCGGAGPSGSVHKPRASVALRRLRSGSPLLSLSVRKGNTGNLRSVVVSLPSGLSLRSRGIRASTPVKVLGSKHRALRLRTRSSKGAARITALAKGGALRVSAGLARRVRKHPSVLVKLRVTDVHGTSFTLKKRVRLR